MKWCIRHLKWLKDFLALENGIASLATVCRMLWHLDVYLFALAFMEWIGEILKPQGIHLVIDGKALRAAASKVKNNRTPMILNALDAVTGLALTQLPIHDKEGEHFVFTVKRNQPAAHDEIMDFF